MKKMILTSAVMLACLAISAQVKLYKTYEDFVNERAETFDNEYIGWKESTFGMAIKFKNDEGQLVKYKIKDFWGFVYKDHLFRSVGSELAMLQDTGKIYYYMNGFAALDLISRPEQHSGYFAAGETYCFTSADSVNADIYRMPISPIDKRDYKALKKDHPEFNELFDCIRLTRSVQLNYQIIRRCVKEFNDTYRKQNRIH